MATATPKMQYRFMGKTGLKVSEICFGAMTFGESSWQLPTANDEELCFKMMDRFVELGGNFLDTADVYGKGSSEMVMGKWLKTKNREDFIVATKVNGAMGPGPNELALSRKHICAAVEGSLKRLQTDYIDLYQVHKFDHGTPLEETLSTLNDLVRIGKVRYIGASNFTGAQLQKAVLVSKYMGFEAFTCIQPQYSLLERHIEWDLVPVSKEEGLGIIPWSPLKGGWLSGKYAKDKKPEAGTRVGWAETVGWKDTNYSNVATEKTWKIVEKLSEVAKSNNKHPAQVALRWILQKPQITAPIIGAKTMEQLEINLGAIGWQLPESDMKILDDVSAIELAYPWSLVHPSVDSSRVH